MPDSLHEYKVFASATKEIYLSNDTSLHFLEISVHEKTDQETDERFKCHSATEAG